MRDSRNGNPASFIVFYYKAKSAKSRRRRQGVVNSLQAVGVKTLGWVVVILHFCCIFVENK